MKKFIKYLIYLLMLLMLVGCKNIKLSFNDSKTIKRLFPIDTPSLSINEYRNISNQFILC